MEDSAAAEYEILELGHPMSLPVDAAATSAPSGARSGRTGFDPFRHNEVLDPGDPALRSREGMGLSASTQDSNTTMTQSATSAASRPAHHRGPRTRFVSGQGFRGKAPLEGSLREHPRCFLSAQAPAPRAHFHAHSRSPTAWRSRPTPGPSAPPPSSTAPSWPSS